MAAEYQITGVQPYTYIDSNNRLIEGYRVYFVILPYNETHHVTVASMDPETIKRAVMAAVAQRKAIGAL